ncbi:33 kDa chaperonin [Porphyridium purpureum]|uniref:33 kDa chaperonin n=1 Tax=Porphyridium purpureum TaxID=35688 RepID=A0A5J4YHG0_PORPP|nr:33 kDa chaperonin [Porphyridium purpureum]|eukprot:POR0350..scf269_36
MGVRLPCVCGRLDRRMVASAGTTHRRRTEDAMAFVEFGGAGGIPSAHAPQTTRRVEPQRRARRNAAEWSAATRGLTLRRRRANAVAAPIRASADEPVAPGSASARMSAISEQDLFLNQAVPGDVMVRTIAQNGMVTVKAVRATGLVAGSCSLFQTSPVASAALGRALVCALLLSCGKKSNETLNLEFRCTGPIRSIVAVSNGQGEVRGYVGNPHVVLPPNKDGKLDVGKAVGEGILACVRNHPFWKNPYTGLVPIESGEVAEDVAKYLLDSEQTPSVLGAGVYVNKEGVVSAAGGFLVELLPEADEQTIALLERNVAELGMSPTELIRSGKSPADIVEMLMRDLNPLQLAESTPRYKCSCSTDRVKRTVALIHEDELKSILEEQGKVEATCEFCGRRYNLTEVEAWESFNAARANE